MINAKRSMKALALAGAALVLASALGACVPLVLGGAAVGGALVATDRRTSAAQLEDETIEFRGRSRVRDAMSGRGNVNLLSYNRQVLVSGEVPTAQEKQQVEQIVSRIENVRGVVNELALMPNSSFNQRSSDALVTGRVKAAMIDARDLSATAFKVVTERGIVYLMGRVTQREANRATEITRSIPGVERVIRVLEVISEEDLQNLAAGQPSKAASAPKP
jgi:osmotically-inducible protein OsmY